MTRVLGAGSRGSALALRQVEIVSDALKAVMTDLSIETQVIHTEGDRRTDVSLNQLGGQGVFVKDIESRLLGDEIDLAIHSLKDMPARIPAGLAIGAVLPRGDVRDVLVSQGRAKLADLPANSRVGTDSRRRVVQLLAMRPDLRIEGVRGNVTTRIGKVESGEYDAVALAAAGLERLSLLDAVGQFFSIAEVMPAVGQAVLAVECRENDHEVLDLLNKIDDQPTRSAISAERSFLNRLGAGCSLPVGAYGTLEGDNLRLRAVVASEAGPIARGETSGPAGEAERLGADLAERLAAEAGLELEIGKA